MSPRFGSWNLDFGGKSLEKLKPSLSARAATGGKKATASTNAAKDCLVASCFKSASTLYVSVTNNFGLSSWMGYSAVTGFADALSIFPDATGLERCLARFPAFMSFSKILITNIHRKFARNGIDGDHVAIFEQADGAALSCFGSNVANTKPASCTREPAVGDKGHLVAHTLAVKRRCG